jgi:hypothetical protein
VTVHTEVPVKVTAWVDEGVAPLVAALAAVSDDLITVESCQGSATQPAVVWFTSHGPSDGLIRLVQSVAEVLSSRLPSSPVVLRLEWCAGAEQPLAQLTVEHDHIGTVADVLRFATDRKSP